MIFRRDSRLCDLCGRRGAGRALEEEEIKFVLGLYDSTPAPRVDVRLCGKCHITYNNIELGRSEICKYPLIHGARKELHKEESFARAGKGSILTAG